MLIKEIIFKIRKKKIKKTMRKLKIKENKLKQI